MRVMGNIYPQSVTVETYLPTPGMVEIRLRENVKEVSVTDEITGITTIMYEYDEYTIVVPDSTGIKEDIAYRDGIRVAPETFTATNAAAMDELMWFGEHIYRSKMAGNVYTPEQAQNAWELVR